jgi:hypothetical protein
MPAAPKTTIKILLAEHDRIAALYQHNVDMGDRYVTTYFTILSVIGAITVGLGQVGAGMDMLLPVDSVLLVLIFIIGLFTFARLVERRIRAVEYLRAINRIHHYFYELDPNLKNYFYWRPFDNFPDVELKGTTLGGLRDIITVCNSLVMSFLVALGAKFYEPGLAIGLTAAIGMVAAVVCWVGQNLYKKRKLDLEKDHLDQKAHFPQIS